MKTEDREQKTEAIGANVKRDPAAQSSVFGPSPSESAPLRLRYYIEYMGIELAAAIVRLLPYQWLRPLAKVLGSIVYDFDRRGREVALENLRCAFREEMSIAKRRQVARASYQTFARTMLELFWSPNLSRSTFEKIAVVEGLDADECHGDPTKPAVYFCFHYSNFEWMSQFGAYLIQLGFVVAQRLKNPLLGPIFDRLRASTGHQIIPQESAFIRMYKLLKRGGKFCMLTDLNLDPREPSVVINCFGMKTCVTQLHAAMALRTGAKLIPVESLPLPDGRYHIRFFPPVEVTPGATVEEIVQQCWDILESTVRAHPEQWLWSYKHWRFRPMDAKPGEYPSYANTAQRFEKKLNEANASKPL